MPLFLYSAVNRHALSSGGDPAASASHEAACCADGLEMRDLIAREPQDQVAGASAL